MSEIMYKIFGERVILVDILAIIFGISSWIAVNGVWVETPILAQTLPEKWNISSYIVLITQVANIGPIIYSILKYYLPLKSIERPAIHSTLLIGSIACLLLTIFWDQITDINGSPHSVVFLVLTGLLALVDCTTTVLYLPFMAHFKSKYLMSYLMGQGMSGLIPSIVSIIQGIGGNGKCVNSTANGNKTLPFNQTFPEYSEPNFTVSVFFIFLLCLVIMSWLAFILLTHLGLCQSERVSNDMEEDERPVQSESTGSKSISIESIDVNYELNQTKAENLSKNSFLFLLTLTVYMSALSNGILPSIQSYSCQAYGNTSYHLSVTLSSMANPIACFIAMYVSAKSIKRSLPLIIGVGTVCAAYIMATALMSPTPPLQDHSFGKVLIVITWIAYTALFSYSRACISTLLRNTRDGHKSLFFFGVSTQIGSTIGAIIMFILCNYTQVFIAYNPCI